MNIYEDRHEARKQEKVIKKEIEEDYIYHELEQNVSFGFYMAGICEYSLWGQLLQHFHKAEVNLDKKLNRQNDLQNNIDKIQIDRAFKKREKQSEHEQRVKLH